MVLAQPHLKADDKILNSSLAAVYHEAERLQLRFLSKHMTRVKEHVLSRTATAATLKPMIDQLYDRMQDDLADRQMFMIHPDLVEFYKQKEPLFGVDVDQKFPRMSEDISEAGKCLSLSRATATVFHLMRVMEIAVQEFGSKVGVALATEKMWQAILDQINKAIKTMDQKQLLTKQYMAISAHLHNVKTAWRNEVMHPNQSYTLAEAKKVFDSAKIFVTDLATVI